MNTNSKTAIVIGATGLTGSHLLQLLFADDRFSRIKVFARRPVNQQHAKLEDHIIDFDKPAEWQHLVTGDVLFSALGTTIKQAGSEQAQYKVDHTYQYQFAEAAARNGVPVYVLVSSAMASPQSKIFYMRMKGELERDVKKLPFAHIHILQPGPLVGERKENRMGEKIGVSLIRFLNKLGIAQKQKPIHGKILAQAMINVSFKKANQLNVYTLLDVFKQAAINVP
jgi:uncharacterized protein YbjT (DUF2867 family)